MGVFSAQVLDSLELEWIYFCRCIFSYIHCLEQRAKQGWTRLAKRCDYCCQLHGQVHVTANRGVEGQGGNTPNLLGLGWESQKHCPRNKQLQSLLEWMLPLIKGRSFTPKEKPRGFCGNPHIKLLFACEEARAPGGNAAATEERNKR